MNYFKKCISILLAVIMIVSSSVVAFATDTVATGQCGDNVYWSLDSEGTLTISGEGAMWNYDLNKKPTYEEYCEDIYSVVFEEGVTYVGECAFNTSGCSTTTTIYTNLKKLVLCDSISVIGRTSFSSVKFDGELCLPENLICVNSNAFDSCSFTSIVFNDKLETIKDAAFARMTKLNCELIFPASITYIGDSAFTMALKVTGKLTFLGDVPEIGKCAFHACARDTDIKTFFTDFPNLFKTVVTNTEESFLEEYICCSCNRTFMSKSHDHHYKLNNTETTAATGLEDGIQINYYICSKGDYEKTETIILHWNADPIEENAYYTEEVYSFESVTYCANCKAELSRNLINLTKVNAKDPTTDTDGNKEYFVDSLGNNYTWDGTKYVLTNNVYIKYCDINDHIKNTRTENHVKDASKNNFSFDLVTYCSVCNEELARDNIELNVVDEVKPTLDSDGNVEYFTDSHGNSYIWDGSKYVAEDNIYVSYCDIYGHTEDTRAENQVKASSETNGSFDLVTYCTVCNEELSRNTVELTTIAEVKPTPETDGNIEYFVDSRGNTYTWDGTEYIVNDDISVSYCEYYGHTEDTKVENEIASTCVSEGSYESVIYCTVCNKELSRKSETIAVSGHNTTIEISDKVAATCSSNGSYTEKQICKNCNKIVSEKTVTVPALGHVTGDTENITIEKSTCSVSGSHKEIIRCANCNEIMSEKTVQDEKTDHNWVESEILSGQYDRYTKTKYICADCNAETIKSELNPNYQFRCKRCDWYDANKDCCGIMKIIVEMIHGITHMVQQINALT